MSRKATKGLELLVVLWRHRTTRRMNSPNTKIKFKLYLHYYYIWFLFLYYKEIVNNCVPFSLVLCLYLCFLIPIWKVTTKYHFSGNSWYQRVPYFLVQIWYKCQIYFFTSVVSNSLRLLKASFILQNSYPSKMTWYKKIIFIIAYSILRLFFFSPLKVTNWKKKSWF